MVILSIYGWDFRVRNDYELECRNKNIDWTLCSPEMVDIEGSKLRMMQDFLIQLNLALPPEQQPTLPKAEPMVAETVNPQAPMGT